MEVLALRRAGVCCRCSASLERGVEAAWDSATRTVCCLVELLYVAWFGDSIRGVPLVGRRGLGRLLKQSGDLQPADRDALARHLASTFPAAS